MKLCTASLLATFAAVACSVGGMTVSLGKTSLAAGGAPPAVMGDAGTAGDPPGAGALSGVGGLNVQPGPTEVTCPTGHETSISGTVYDPAGTVRLYNAVVYVPRVPGELPPQNDQVACETCADPVPARAATLSDADGHFVLKGVPAGNVELVVQLGKWRRKQSVTINPCQDNPLTDKDLTRLPRNRAEGHIPKIALSTGHSDALECLLRKIGVDDSEFTTDAGPGRVNLFVGCVSDDGKKFGANQFASGGKFPSTNQLFDSGELMSYDMVIFSCEGHKCDSIQTPDHVAQLVAFANAGGRVFLDHDHYNWLNHSNAPIEKAAQFSSSPDGVPSPLTTQINTSFPKGAAFAEWLRKEGASQTLGSLDIYNSRTSVVSLSPNRAQSWIFRDSAPTGFFYFTIGTPVAKSDTDPAPEACGRVVFTDLHVSNSVGDATDFSDQDTPFPNGCLTTDLSGQEKALEFMLFDLSSCVQQDSAAPAPPVLR